MNFTSVHEIDIIIANQISKIVQ